MLARAAEACVAVRAAVACVAVRAAACVALRWGVETYCVSINIKLCVSGAVWARHIREVESDEADNCQLSRWHGPCHQMLMWHGGKQE